MIKKSLFCFDLSVSTKCFDYFYVEALTYLYDVRTSCEAKNDAGVSIVVYNGRCLTTKTDM